MSSSFVGRELRAVVVPQRQPAEGIQIIAIELYADGLIVRWLDTAPSSPAPGEHPIGDPPLWSKVKDRLGFSEPGELSLAQSISISAYGGDEFKVEDDVGTRYWSDGGSGSGTLAVWRGEMPFVPPAPSPSHPSAHYRRGRFCTGGAAAALNRSLTSRART